MWWVICHKLVSRSLFLIRYFIRPVLTYVLNLQFILFYFFGGCPNSLARSVAICIPLAMVDRTRPSSNANNPAIVQPPGALKRLRQKNIWHQSKDTYSLPNP